jgi:translocation and assembly module TamA
MRGRGFRLCGAQLLCAAAAASFMAGSAEAQKAASPAPPPPPPDAAELDPNAPLAPMPGLGVEWPELNPKDTAPAAEPTTAKTPRSKTSHAVGPGTGDIRYSVSLEGLGAIGDAGELTRQFRAQSTLEAERKNPANAAQIGRRAEADSDLLTQLLRSQGYYDAQVEPRTEQAGNALRVVLAADAGLQYGFA